jgi:uncharacterized circularly permuted ATP-grasp superfamily protein
VPRLITAAEWRTISSGILQRARALDRFAADVYGGREIVAAGIVPERVIEGAADYEPAMRDAPAPKVWVSVVGFDLVRGTDGHFQVLEDNLRMPSGIAYTVAAREALHALLPAGPGLPSPAPVGEAFARIGEALRAAAPDRSDAPSVVLLSEGEEGAGWYEHRRLGEELGIPVLTLTDLERRGDRLVARVDGDGIEVDVVYVRTDEDRLTGAGGEPTELGGLVLEPCRAGWLACVNAPGAGVGDDKLAHAYVEEMIRFYLGEEPILESVTTYDLARPEVRERAMAKLAELVVKPRGEMGGEGVVVFSEASEEERRAAPSATSTRSRAGSSPSAGSTSPGTRPSATGSWLRATSTCAPTSSARPRVSGRCPVASPALRSSVAR